MTHFCVNGKRKCKCLNSSVHGIFLSVKFQCGNNVNVFCLSPAYIKNLKFFSPMCFSGMQQHFVLLYRIGRVLYICDYSQTIKKCSRKNHQKRKKFFSHRLSDRLQVGRYKRLIQKIVTLTRPLTWPIQSEIQEIKCVSKFERLMNRIFCHLRKAYMQMGENSTKIVTKALTFYCLPYKNRRTLAR
jgi:hypothetical protein